MVARSEKKGEKAMTAVWDSATAALDEIDAAVKAIADVDATLTALAEAKKRIDDQVQTMRRLRQLMMARRNRSMATALSGKVEPEVVAARADVKLTTMYTAVARLR